MNRGNLSLWSWFLIPILPIYAISPNSIGLLLMTSTCCFSYDSCNTVWWWPVKSWSMNGMPIAPQPISPSVVICLIFMLNVQVITKCSLPIDPSNTSTLLTERPKITKHFTAFDTKLFTSTQEPSFFNWLNLVPNPWNLYWFLLHLLLHQPP